MGGGKETPRQKMIGMMYLVLMAMLALNVSKSIIDAFVAIEENMQIANQNEFARGDEKRNEIAEKVKFGDTPEVKAKAKKLLDVIDKIDKLAAEQIQYIDALKLEILSEIKEDPEKLKEGPEDKGFMIVKGFNPKEPIKPIRFRLAKVQNKDKYDEVMRIMGIAESTKKPSTYACKTKFASGKKGGIELWNNMQKFRGEICKILVDASSNDSVKFTYIDPKINKFENQESLKAEIQKLFKTKKWKIDASDSATVSEMYISLTKNEMVKSEHEEGEMEHWIGKTFNHAPSVGAIASLSSLQKEILTARADAVASIRAKLGGGDYSFNAIRALATPKFAVVNPGDEIEIEVSMAAYDTDKQPEIKPNQGSLKGKPSGGVGVVTARATSGKMEFTGTVAITNKFGKQKIEKYSTVVQVAAGGGALEIPEYAILYRNYPNFIVPSLAGAVKVNLSSTCGATPSTKNGKKGYIVKPGSGVKSVTVNLSGKDGADKTINGVKTTYVVKPFPKPVVQNATCSKSSGAKIKVVLPPESPIAGINFKVLSVDVLNGDDGFCPGDIIPAAKIAKIRSGKSVGIIVKAKNLTTGEDVSVDANLKVQ
jgi:hypothetical protein